MFPGRPDPPLYPEFLQGPYKPKAIHHGTNRANQTSLIGIDLMGCRGNVIPPRGADISDHRIDLNVRMQLAQPEDLIIDVTGLDRTAAGAIDPQDHGAGFWVFEGSPQARNNIILKNIFQRRARCCSVSAAKASRSITFRSQPLSPGSAWFSMDRSCSLI